jgi:hypothetical protein
MAQLTHPLDWSECHGAAVCQRLTIAAAVARAGAVRLAEMSMFWIKCLCLAPKRPRAA